MLIILLPFAAIGSLVIGQIEDGLTEHISEDLINTGSLEAAHIEESLTVAALSGQELLETASLRSSLAAELAERNTDAPSTQDAPDSRAIDADRTAPARTSTERPLNDFIQGIAARRLTEFSRVQDLAVTNGSAEILGQTADYSWVPEQSTIDLAISSGQTTFGNAFRALDGSPRLGMVVPIVASDNDVDLGYEAGDFIGVALMETDLWSTGFSLSRHAELGEGAEAFLIQTRSDGTFEPITALRYEGPAMFSPLDASYQTVLRTAMGNGSNGQLPPGNDYRGVESLHSVRAINGTDLYLVNKIDFTEAFAPVQNARQSGLIAIGLTALLVILCTALVVRPLIHRLRRLSAVSGQIASGSYNIRVDDSKADEVGDLGRSIDSMANGLERDRDLRNTTEEQLRAEARQDHLTGISNRQVALESMHELASSGSDVWSVLFVDLDGFKPVNDRYGHHAGDQVLQLFATQLTKTAATNATVARWGGDEFVVVLPNVGERGARREAARLKRALSHRLIESEYWVPELGWSVGISSASADETDVAAVIRRADQEMLLNKPEASRTKAPSAAESDIEDALASGRIEVFYQPIVNLKSGEPEVAGAEALVRMVDLEGKIVPPAMFLPEVADSPIGAELDQFVVATATRDAAQWIAQGLAKETFQVGVNFGPASLRSTATPDRIARALQNSSLPPTSFVAELSETAPIADASILARLRASGVEISIDDVGIHHSNFDRLLDLQPNYAKLDKRWLLSERERKSGIVKHLVHAVLDLGLQPVVEGVEGPEEAQLVADLGVMIAQGYHYGRPMPKAEFEASLTEHDNSAAITL